MKSERLARLHLDGLAFDLETDLIQPGLVAPPMVLGSAAEVGPDGKLHGQLLTKDQVRALIAAVFTNRQTTVCVANGPYDLLVLAVDAAARGEDIMPQIYDLYDPDRTIVRGHCDGRVFDVQRAEELHAIAQGHLFKDPHTLKPLTNRATGKQGRYSLDTVTELVTGRIDAKVNDRFRLSYAQFHDVPFDQLPYEAARYPVDDVINTLEDALGQAGHVPSCWSHDWKPGASGDMLCWQCGISMTPDAPNDCMVRRPRRNLHDLARQCYAAWALHLGDAWGFNVNQASVDALEAKYAANRAAESQPFIDAGVIRDDGSENTSVTKKLVAEAYGARDACPKCNATGKVPSPKTNGKTKINCDVCQGTALLLPPEVPRTDKGGIGTGRDVLQESGDEFLMSKAEFDEGEKILTTYVPLLRRGRVCVYCNQHGTKKSEHLETCPTWAGTEPAWRPVPLNPRSNTLVETGRCSYADGIHGLPRKGGVRECFEARPGYVFSSEDFTAGELVMHAQNCIWLVGYSKLAIALNQGLDAHLALAGTMLGKNYDEMLALKKAKNKLADDNRQAAKAANFGFAGGMAELTFTLRKRSEPGLFTPCENGPDVQKGVRGYKGLRTCIVMDGNTRCGIIKVTEYNRAPCPPVCLRCLESAKRLREFWFQQWPENNRRDGYFALIPKLLEANNQEITQHKTKRVRGAVDFCEGANGFFQSMLADAMKNAYCQISRECYDRTVRVQNSEFMTSKYAGGPSPLFGSRPILLAHDETIAEHPESVAHDAATRVSEIMVEAERFMAPDLAQACKAEPTLMRKLYKGAEPVFDANNRLIPWEPS